MTARDEEKEWPSTWAYPRRVRWEWSYWNHFDFYNGCLYLGPLALDFRDFKKLAPPTEGPTR